jgi:inosine-uridine nucleoside N-ribohydrolase
VLDLDADEEEVDLAHDHIFQMVSADGGNKEILEQGPETNVTILEIFLLCA